MDDPPVEKVVDVFGGLAVARRVAQNSIVLLKNAHGRLPLDARRLRSIAVIGGHADVGVLSGGGSAQVDPPGGNAVPPPPGVRTGFGGAPVWLPSSPLAGDPRQGAGGAGPVRRGDGPGGGGGAGPRPPMSPSCSSPSR